MIPMQKNMRCYSYIYNPYLIDTNKSIKVIDFRSDILSLPTEKMRQAIYRAEVGENTLEEDPTVLALERKAADLFEKEAACFLPSGTMSNLIAVIVHCGKGNSEIIAGDESHLFLCEHAGVSLFGGKSIQEIKNRPDGTFDITKLQHIIRQRKPHSPVPRLICVENTHNQLGGKVLPLEWLQKLSKYAKFVNIPVHMDGARIFNAAVKLNLPVAELTEGMDSVCFSLNKGLGGPYGSVLVGSADFIDKVRNVAFDLGVSIGQIGFMAAAGIYALDNMVLRLDDDHKKIQRIATSIRNLKNPYVTVPDSHSIHTNILMIYLNHFKFTSKDFLTQLNTVTKTDENPVVIKAFYLDKSRIRFVVSCNILDSDVDYAIEKLTSVINDFV